MIETYHNDEVIRLINFDTVERAEKWIRDNQRNYDDELHVGTHVKDGYVVFIYR